MKVNKLSKNFSKNYKSKLGIQGIIYFDLLKIIVTACIEFKKSL